MSQGIKNMQTAARACTRREGALSGSPSLQDPLQKYDDSGVSGIDDLEAECDADGASNHSGPSGLGGYGQYQDHHQNRAARQHGGVYVHAQGLGQAGSRLSSMDMGIGAIINRHDGR